MFWKKSVIKNAFMLIGIFLLLTIYLFIFIHYDKMNKEGHEIVNSPSFVGQVVSKKTQGAMWPSGTGYIYKMRIIGEYYSDDNEIIYFNRNLIVGKEMFYSYEVGDIISH